MGRAHVASKRSIRLSRDGILFAVGLAGIGYETLVEGGDKPTLLILFAAMVGLPAFLHTDEKIAPTPPPAVPPPAPEVVGPPSVPAQRTDNPDPPRGSA